MRQRANEHMDCVTVQRLDLLLCGILSLLSPAAAAQPEAPAVAWVFDAAVRCSDFAANDPASCAGGLLQHVRAKVAATFIARHRLEATDGELKRLKDYSRTFERHDRSHRARKLAELEARLATETLAPNERTWLEDFRAVLLRMAEYEADIDAGIEKREPVDEETLRRWIETGKLNAALYARYGGSIGLAPYGPYAHGAMRTLIAQHVERGDIRILDPVVADRFIAVLAAPPRLAHTGGEPDFTPFWDRPIPPSYMSH